MRFAMIPINRRYNDNNERVVRRVLISFSRKYAGIYKNSKLVEVDPYFKDMNSSHRYQFDDDGFKLVHDAYGDNFYLNLKRPYEFDAGNLYEKSIEFQADTIEEAIEKFNNRQEVH